MKQLIGKLDHKIVNWGLLSSWMVFSLTLTPAAIAQNARLGVVKGKDNENQWSEIVTRLQLSQADYCVIDQSKLKDLDQAQISILLLPNLENLDTLQADSLTRWMGKGGKIIATGPIGGFSQPQVRNQLRSLLGAYWGFTLSNPATLKPLPINSEQWVRYGGQNNTFVGGVVIPSGLDSKTTAVWNTDGSPPAVVTTQQSVFFGWRWGLDNVTSPQFDATWLQAALSRYGNLVNIGSNSSNVCVTDTFTPTQATQATQPKPVERVVTTPTPTPKPVETVVTTPTPTPKPVETVVTTPTPTPKPVETPRQTTETQVVTSTQTTSQQPVATSPLAMAANRQIENPGITTHLETNSEGWRLIVDPEPPTSPNTRRTPSTPYHFQAMGNELETLISRVETVVLGSDIYHNNNNLSSANKENHSSQGNNIQTKQALLEARQRLENFERLTAAGQYEQARQEWQIAHNLIWENYPSDRQAINSEIRAIWLDRGTLVKMKSEADLAHKFDQFAAAGINTVFLETLNASYPIYPSKIAPQQNPLIQGWDPLKSAIKLAKERNMELHAWLWIFAAANQRHNQILNQPSEYLGPVLTRNPDWVNIDRQGNLFHPQTRKAFFDPANDELRAYLLSILDEIVTNYDVDGIQLDYIRYPFQDPWSGQLSGYGKAGRQKFMARTGVDPLTINLRDPLWTEWNKFRVEQIDSFVATASQQLKAKKPNLIISAAVFPMSQGERVNKIQQNWEEWMKQASVDLIVLMTYASDSNQLQRLAQPILTRPLEGSALLLPGIRLLNLPDLVSLDQVQLLRSMPTAGYALFAAENLNPNLQKLFNLNQGEVTSEVLPTREPFKAALYRYRNLQQEWDFLMNNQQLTMEETELSNLSEKMKDLEENLKNLANNPSSRNYFFAYSILKSFRTEFTKSTSRNPDLNTYQVKSWENRLASLEQLLRYGERVKIQ
jgi:uncharacterized lipoprotein YddW (UPF0748 family)